MTIRFLQGNAVEMLQTLPANSVQCVVTSPPYYGLRDYGTATWAGGDTTCSHQKHPAPFSAKALASSTIGAHANTNHASEVSYRDTCGLCGATRQDAQLGLEAVMDCLGWATGAPCASCYICRMVQVFEEVKRVLRKDGVCFVNIGDSYAGHNARGFRPGNEVKNGGVSNKNGVGYVAGLKPKDLCMVPARLALALQAAGWWIRSEIIWSKPSPLPESVTDRPTKAHEQIFLLTKSPTYFWDQEAVREKAQSADRPQPSPRDKQRVPSDTPWHDNRYAPGATGYGVSTSGRNLRTVWEIPSEPTPMAHFATFPTALVEKCLRAGTSHHGACGACKTPWVRVIESRHVPQTFTHGDLIVGKAKHWKRSSHAGPNDNGTYLPPQTTGWRPSCPCGATAPIVPCTVLDMFAGSGTVGLVADRLQRDAILIDLSAEYIAMARERITAEAPLLCAGWPAAPEVP